jgi:hypothetical protein
MYQKNADVPGLLKMEIEELVLYPTKQTVNRLRLEAEGTNAKNEAEVQVLMVSAGELEAFACVRLWRAIHELQPGEDFNFEVNDFDDFMKTFLSFRVLVRLDSPWDCCRVMWLCSCVWGQKYGVCKHGLLQTMLSGGCELPDAYKHGTTMRKRKKGRPKKTKPALTRQPGDFVPSDSDSESDAPEPESPKATEPELDGSPVAQKRSARARKATAVHDV